MIQLHAERNPTLLDLAPMSSAPARAPDGGFAEYLERMMSGAGDSRPANEPRTPDDDLSKRAFEQRDKLQQTEHDGAKMREEARGKLQAEAEAGESKERERQARQKEQGFPTAHSNFENIRLPSTVEEPADAVSGHNIRRRGVTEVGVAAKTEAAETAAAEAELALDKAGATKARVAAGKAAATRTAYAAEAAGKAAARTTAQAVKAAATAAAAEENNKAHALSAAGVAGKTGATAPAHESEKAGATKQGDHEHGAQLPGKSALQKQAMETEADLAVRTAQGKVSELTHDAASRVQDALTRKAEQAKGNEAVENSRSGQAAQRRGAKDELQDALSAAHKPLKAVESRVALAAEKPETDTPRARNRARTELLVDLSRYQTASESEKAGEKQFGGDSRGGEQDGRNALSARLSGLGTSAATVGRSGAGGGDFASLLSSRLAGDTGAEIVRHAQMVVRGEQNGEMRLVLRPDNLGSIRVRMQMEDGLIAVRFLVENNGVRQALEQNLASLAQAFRDAGLETSSLDVSVGNGANGNADQQGQGKPARYGVERLAVAVPGVSEYGFPEHVVNLIA